MTDALRADPEIPHPDRLSSDHHSYVAIMRAHAAAVEAGQPGYLDPVTGLFVMTAEHHVRRGRCCHNGCRHCPYTGAGEGT